MCGVVGYVSRDAGSEAFRLRDAVGTLSHRGPDENGVWEQGPVGLGHARLSIIDLSGGQQPMRSPDGRYVLSYNGEIYNFPVLREELERRGERFVGHSDTEILLRLFALQGLDGCLARLRGMFAFAVWDTREQCLYLARDRLGVKPLVYAETPDGFLFASEIAALFSLSPTLSRDPDYPALDHYLTFQYIPSPMSGFRAVRKLPPAHAMVVKDGKIQRQWRYWDVDFSRRSDLGFDDACEALREKFLEATRLRLVSDVPLGAFLSGGIDSSLTVAAMTHLGAGPVRTFAIGFEDEKFNELPYARRIAEHLATEHREMVVRPDAVEMLPKLVQHYGEPLADNSAMPTYYVSRFAREHVTVALTGDGADETFAGYKRFYQGALLDRIQRSGLMPAWRGLRRVTVALENRARPAKGRAPFPSTRMDEATFLAGIDRYKHLLAFYPDPEKEAVMTPEFRARVGMSRTSDYLASHMARAAGADGINRYLYLDTVTYMPEDILFKVDIASMLPSLECRSPFLDHELIEFAASLPGRYKLRGSRGKHILKEAFKAWLPEGYMERGKMGFSAPLPAWLRHDLAPLLRERLLGEQRLAPLVSQDVVSRYVDEHTAGTTSHSKRLWPLLVLAEWVERFRVAL